MGKYKILLIDADGTLFDYDRAERNALRETLSLYGFEFSEKALRQYRRISHDLEIKMERGEISQSSMQSKRFAKFFEAMHIQCDASEFNSLFTKELANNAFLLDDALLICAEIFKLTLIYIISNGVSPVQRTRLTRSGLMPYLNGLFISDDVGFPKPHRYFFDAVFAQLSDVPRDKYLIVGDSLTADIAAGHSVGVDTCWYNPKEVPIKDALRPTYEINSLIELLDIVS